MGYRPKKRRAELRFKGTFHDGAEVGTDLSASAGVVQDMQIAINVGKLTDIHEIAAEHVILDWNIERDDGELIPITMEGLREIDHNLLMTILNSWLEAIGKIDAPLSGPSNNGSTQAPTNLENLAQFSESLQHPSTTGG